MNKNDIDKNIIDLEYQYLLNLQNLILGFIGAAIITVSFSPILPANWPSKEDIIFILVFIALIFFFYFNVKLDKKLKSIKKIKNKKISKSK